MRNSRHGIAIATCSTLAAGHRGAGLLGLLLSTALCCGLPRSAVPAYSSGECSREYLLRRRRGGAGRRLGCGRHGGGGGLLAVCGLHLCQPGPARAALRRLRHAAARPALRALTPAPRAAAGRVARVVKLRRLQHGAAASAIQAMRPRLRARQPAGLAGFHTQVVRARGSLVACPPGFQEIPDPEAAVQAGRQSTASLQ